MVGDLARLLARASANGGHGNDRPTRDLGRAEHPCSAAAGQGWPALPDASGRDAVAPLPRDAPRTPLSPCQRVPWRLLASPYPY